MSDILGYKIFSGSKDDFLNKLFDDSFNKVNIVSGNPEVLHMGLSNGILNKNFNSDNSVIIPDGFGVVLASKLINQPVKEKIAGIEVMEAIIKHCAENGKSIFLLGAKEELLNKCAENLTTKYPSLIIGGKHNGYFDMDNCEDIISSINTCNPYAVFVAMGAPRQEMFIINYFDKIDAKIFMGVGGSFDVFAGKVSRAPQWMINSNLEWLYRVSKEPFRIKRLGVIPKFVLKAVSYKGSNS
ncbi:WecB/TagA/CpsF family glycosyltransferase [Clostridium sp. 19966]|uniref:WecB/TagA/CpsF family glycosyltransferase n=1 Tax=Clostridium sp. 19966 TaxID=2768166 RepID=UPI0028DF0674|nr:WecB/TagA/CpsF family glycosyltransferase [Clostridium sp. 19966]MDT8716117.1 WecB/TagA/CpsF family glycosyltransferase [Clostridium sp. 19966]